MMRRWIEGLVLGVAVMVAGCHHVTPSTAAANGAVEQIAWREGDVDDAFAEARESHKPVLLYWGAKWCPPCNLMKQTLFRDPAFVAQTRNFIPVHLDGDTKGAQSWGERFGIAGYPTVILLRPDRSEITRLSSGSATATLANVLRVAATQTASGAELIGRAAKNPGALSKDDWSLLASFDWMDDPKHFGDDAREATLLAKLSAAAPDPAMKRHFALIALIMAGTHGAVAKLTPPQKAEVPTILSGIFADYVEIRANRQELSYAGVPLIRAVPDATVRKRLGNALITALDRVAADDTIPLGDRMMTLNADIALAKDAAGPHGKVAPAVLAKVRQRIAWVDRAATNPMLRQAVMPNAGSLLDDAGDNAGATRLLVTELPHAIAPYYFMIDLSNFAEERKDKAGAIAWAHKAYETSDGRATRVQWAIMYSDAVVRLAPDDKRQVEASADAVIDELGKGLDGYFQRTRKHMASWGGSLRKWAAAHDGDDVMKRLEGKMDDFCAKQAGDARASCNQALKSA